ncbi:MAG: TetR/AcrR family transcriptional regulator [Myxococcota bacterium]
MSTRPLRSDAEASRTRILEAARALFGEQGSPEVTMAEVALRAGVSRATVFNHFGSKQVLVEGVTEEVFAGYEAILDRALADETTPVPVLVRARFHVMADGIAADPRFYRTAFREISRVTLGLAEGGVARQARQRAVERLVHLLTRGQARGELDAGFEARALATAFDSLVFGTLTHWLYDDASESLVDRMLAAADVFLGPVGRVPATWAGPDPDLWREGDAGFGNTPGGTEA